MSESTSSANVAAAGTARKKDWPKHLAIWCFLVIELLPFYMMMQISVKDNTQFLASPWIPSNPSGWLLSNYRFGLDLVLPFLANTIFVAVIGTFGTITLALLSAYFFARYRMPGSRVIFGVFMFLMLMPGVANLIPLFTLLKSMGLLNSLWTLIILGIAGGQVFAIFMLRNFIEEIPSDLFEAAEIDGASHMQQIWNVVIPMSAPVLGTLAILTFLGYWNDFLMPLIILRDRELFTLGVGLIYLDGEYVKPWGKVMAAFFLASLPLIIVFLFTMKLFVRGLSAGAVKG